MCEVDEWKIQAGHSAPNIAPDGVKDEDLDQGQKSIVSVVPC